MINTQIQMPNEETLNMAKELILSSQILAMPTETVYGLCANAFDDEAIKKIFKAKGRPQDNPLIVHISDINQLEKIAYTNDLALTLAKNFWPGPLTMVLPKKDSISNIVSGNLDTVAVRMPNHKVALQLIEKAKVPLCAPSANISGKPSPTKASHVYDDFNGKIKLIIDGGECSVGVESTVVSVSDDEIVLLRPGLITANDLSQFCNNVKISDGVLNQIKQDEKVLSPGMKYKHYAPKQEVIMLDGDIKQFAEYVYLNADEHSGVLVFDSEESLFSEQKAVFTYGKENDSKTQANQLFDALRKIDKHSDINKVYTRMPNKNGVGLAVYNRLLRACGFKIIKLKKPFIVGLTGQTGSGKSTVCKTFINNGIAVIDCDKVSREVINNEYILNKLVDYFGQGIMYADNTLNRKELGILAFSSEENLIFLNGLMYPEITRVIKEKIEKLKQTNDIIVLDAPTLFESKADILCDMTISVIADKDIRLNRIILRDNLTENEAKLRMNAQHDNEFYIDKCDVVIENDGDINALEQKAVDVIDCIKQKSKEKKI